MDGDDDHDMTEGEFKREYIYTCSKCLQIDKRFLIFITQMSMLLIILLFSIVQLTKPNTENRDVYVNILLLILGIVLPQPSINKK